MTISDEFLIAQLYGVHCSPLYKHGCPYIRHRLKQNNWSENEVNYDQLDSTACC